MAVHVVNHPLAQHKLGLIRANTTSTSEFRALTSELTQILAVKATENLPTETISVEGWAGPVNVERISGKMLTIVPILRAGIGMQDGFISLVPGAKISVVGMFRNEETLTPVHYFVKLAPHINERTAIILDPMLATGGTLCDTIDVLKEAGCRDIRGIVLLAAPEGIATLNKRHPEVDVYTAAIDDKLNEIGYILPGLGDAGDRLFGTNA